MKLLQHSWSDMLVLDHMHQRMHNSLPDETTLPNGQKFDLLSLGLLGVPSLAEHFTELTATLQDLKFDVSDYICVKFLLLLNPGKYDWLLQLTLILLVTYLCLINKVNPHTYNWNNPLVTKILNTFIIFTKHFWS